MHFIVLYVVQWQFKCKQKILLGCGITKITQFILCGLFSEDAFNQSEEKYWKHSETGRKKKKKKILGDVELAEEELGK